MTDTEIIADVLKRELAPDEPTWASSRARVQAADKGGATRGGITARSWGQFKGWARDATRAELDAITEAEALAATCPHLQGTQWIEIRRIEAL